MKIDNNNKIDNNDNSILEANKNKPAKSTDKYNIISKFINIKVIKKIIKLLVIENNKPLRSNQWPKYQKL